MEGYGYQEGWFITVKQPWEFGPSPILSQNGCGEKVKKGRENNISFKRDNIIKYITFTYIENIFDNIL